MSRKHRPVQRWIIIPINIRPPGDVIHNILESHVSKLFESLTFGLYSHPIFTPYGEISKEQATLGAETEKEPTSGKLPSHGLLLTLVN